MFKYVSCFEWDKIIDLSEEQFSILEDSKSTYVKNNIKENFGDGDEDADAIIKFGHIDKKPYVTFTKFVGLLALKDGLIIEVLPKLFRPDDISKTVSAQNNNKPEEPADVEKHRYARALVLTMLRACGRVKNKHFQKAHLSSCRLPLFEIFIRMFIDEANELVRRGLMCGYETVEHNKTFFKGKIIISKHIQYNAAHRERCFVQYDEFSVNRLENRLIKSTLEFLSCFSTDSQNQLGLKRLLDLFEDVDSSSDFMTDITKYNRDRNMSDYDNIMTWCRLFMEGKSFSIYRGSNIAFALMYPMEKLYEEYIANCLENILRSGELQIKRQESCLYLFEEPKRFKLKPDIVITATDGREWILDTKWKILNIDPSKNYGIHQNDMYQMYAYYYRYVTKQRNIQSVILLYPTESLIKQQIQTYIECPFNDSAKIHVSEINLYRNMPDDDLIRSELDSIDDFVCNELRVICSSVGITS